MKINSYNVRPRYSPGSPAAVDEATARRSAREERDSYETALSGAWGDAERQRAELLGLDGIAYELWEEGRGGSLSAASMGAASRSNRAKAASISSRTRRNSATTAVERETSMNHLALGDIFTDDQLRTAELCVSIEELRECVVEPNIVQINERVGQENCPQFLAYMLGAALMSQGWPFRRAGQA